MKVLQRAKTPNGTEIQVEDWRQDYSFYTGYTVAAYPIAERTGTDTGVWAYPIGGESFRLALIFDTTEQALKAFEQLQNGTATLKDFEKNAEYIGHSVIYNGVQYHAHRATDFI